MGSTLFRDPRARSSALAALGTLQPRALGSLNRVDPLDSASNYYLFYSSIIITGKFPPEANTNNCSHHDLGSKLFPTNALNKAESNRNTNESLPALPHEKQNFGVATRTSTSEYEDTAGLLPPPPLPPKSRNI